MTSEPRCAAGERCAGYDRREGVAELRDGHPVMCESCLSAAERVVPLLVRDYADLEQHIAPSSSRGDGQPRGTGEPPSLVRVDVEALQRRIWWVLTTWEDALRDRTRLSDAALRRLAHPAAAPPRLKHGAEVQRAAGIIQPRLRLLARVGVTTVIGYPDLDDDQAFRLGAVEYAELPGWRGVVDFVRLHRKALAVQQLTDARPELCVGVPCRSCDVTALYREPVEEGIRCGHCGERMTAEEYRRWVGQVSAYAEREA